MPSLEKPDLVTTNVRHRMPSVHPEGRKFVVISVAIVLLFWLLGWKVLAWPMVGVTLWVAAFFRDPIRTTPKGEDLVIAPADGMVTMIADVLPPIEFTAEDGLGSEPRIRVSIFMSIFDVHINRAPVAGQIKRVDVAMAIEVEQQNIVVSDDTPTVSVEAGGNANSLVLKDKDLDALSDDPDELSNELQALAGPSAGPNGGQIYIDGFTGGQLPPKSAIREIRVNQNPFSAEYDRLGYGRIEILTKPGTDKLHGQAFVMGNTSATNTGSPFIPNVPPYYRVQYNASVSGALSKKASFYLSVEQRDNHEELDQRTLAGTSLAWNHLWMHVVTACDPAQIIEFPEYEKDRGDAAEEDHQAQCAP